MKALLFTLLLTSNILHAQTINSVYYLSIGSINYSSSFRELSEASYSANRIGELFSKYANAKGITFNSTNSNKVTKRVFFEQLDKVWSLIEKEQPTNPLLVIYFCGHGFADSLVGSQFLISGDFELNKETLTFEKLIAKNIHLFDIQQWILSKQFQLTLLNKELRYLVLLDCCRNPINNDALNVDRIEKLFGTTYSEQVKKGFGIANDLIENLYNNQFAILDPIVFSTKVLDQATICPYPDNTILKGNYADINVGPICRRSLIQLQKSKKEGKTNISLYDFVDGLINDTLDAKSAVSRSIYNKSNATNCSLFQLK